MKDCLEMLRRESGLSSLAAAGGCPPSAACPRGQITNSVHSEQRGLYSDNLATTSRNQKFGGEPCPKECGSLSCWEILWQRAPSICGSSGPQQCLCWKRVTLAGKPPR